MRKFPIWEGGDRMPIAGILERIDSSLDFLAGSEAKVARWILQNPEKVLGLTIRDLAVESRSSQAAVVRLCRTLKIDGFSALKVLLTADVVRQEHRHSTEYSEINPDAPFGTQLQAFGGNVVDSIQNTLNDIDEAALHTVNQQLHRASRILTFGVAASHITAEDLAQKLTRMGFATVSWNDVHMAVVNAALLHENDVAFVVSYSGTTREALEVADLVRGRGAFLVAITQFHPRNPLAELAHVVFHVTAVEPAPRIGATTSVLASLLIGDALVLWLANHEADRTLTHLKQTEQAVRPHRT